ncbi:MAG: RNA polymerase sigma factor [Deltaproteobacteria bacterium]|nr:RNA polymerase sigma factor [Deltaproteobacteria bacterium]
MFRNWDGHARASRQSAASTAPASPAGALDALVRRHHGALLGAAHKLCRSHFDPSDLVQDTFERAIRNYDRLAPGSNERAWLMTILTNLFIDRVRRKKAEPLK